MTFQWYVWGWSTEHRRYDWLLVDDNHYATVQDAQRAAEARYGLDYFYYDYDLRIVGSDGTESLNTRR